MHAIYVLLLLSKKWISIMMIGHLSVEISTACLMAGAKTLHVGRDDYSEREAV